MVSLTTIFSTSAAEGMGKHNKTATNSIRQPESILIATPVKPIVAPASRRLSRGHPAPAGTHYLKVGGTRPGTGALSIRSGALFRFLPAQFIPSRQALVPGNQACPTLVGEIRPCPLHQHDNAIAESD